MLILVDKGKKPKGFWLNRRAKQGKLPPSIVGLTLGKYPCVLLQMYGKITPETPFLAPYLRRGDTVITATRLGDLGFNRACLFELAARQSLNHAKELAAGLPKGEITLIFDPKGDCMGVTAEFCALGGAVWVCTPHKEAYAPCREYCLLEYGNPPVVGSQPPRKPSLTVAPYGLPKGVCLADSFIVAPTHIWAKEEGLTLPEELVHATPRGFDPTAVTAGCMVAFGGELLEYKAVLCSGRRDGLPD